MIGTNGLAAIRSRSGLKQVDMAERMGCSQARVSNIERMPLDSVPVSWLARYVVALGGQLQVRAIFPDGTTIMILDTGDASTAVDT
jgi:DNA-binding XRE family transcriptional regulator